MPVAGGGFEQCYNGQAAVTDDSLLVLATDVVQVANSLPSRRRGTNNKSSQCWASWRRCRRIWAGRKPCSATAAISVPPMLQPVPRTASRRCSRPAARRITPPWTGALPRCRRRRITQRRSQPCCTAWRHPGPAPGEGRGQETLCPAQAHPGAGVRYHQVGAGLPTIPAARARQGSRRVEPGDYGLEYKADLRPRRSVRRHRTPQKST
jgi:hypothetical protein